MMMVGNNGEKAYRYCKNENGGSYQQWKAPAILR
jgi:hypothetical protein